MKLKPFFEAVKMHETRKAFVKSLFEAGYLDAELEAPAMADDAGAEVKPDAADPNAALWTGFKASIDAVIDGNMSAAEKHKRIGELLRAHEKLTGDGGEASEPMPEEDEKDGKCKDDEKKLEEDRWSDGTGANNRKEEKAMFARMRADGEMGESIDLKAKLAAAEAERDAARSELAVRTLCEAHKIEAKPALVKALAALPSEADRKALLESIKPGTLTKPRTVVVGKPVKSGDNYASFLESIRN